MKYLSFLILPLFIFLFFNEANSSCCSWDDKKACASCPNGYASGCVTKKDTCNCACAENEFELAIKLAKSFGDSYIGNHIRNNFNRIMRDTDRYGYHEYNNIKISITTPTR